MKQREINNVIQFICRLIIGFGVTLGVLTMFIVFWPYLEIGIAAGILLGYIITKAFFSE